jgi:hypothetical protein
MDFTLRKYQTLLLALQQAGFRFVSFEDFCEGRAGEKFVILRHDIDKMPENALKIAKLEAQLSIKATYFFLTTKAVFKENIIQEIKALGHEIGYHYKDLVEAGGNTEKAIASFEKNLSLLRAIAPVKTIAMDGCPTSKIDNKDIWKKHNYRDFGIIGEPYFDIDFNQIFYLTDTGRMWDGDKYSVRDKVRTTFTQKYHTTNQIIKAAKDSRLPDKIMLTTHPQRWTDSRAGWLKEYLGQSAKNQIKYLLNIGKRNG